MKRTKFALLSGLVVMAIIAVTVVIGYRQHENTLAETYKNAIRYESYQIERGDSLYSIASSRDRGGRGIKVYIEAVKSLNSLKTDTIHTGGYLLLPQYK